VKDYINRNNSSHLIGYFENKFQTSQYHEVL